MNEPDVQVAPRDNPYFGLEYFNERFGAWFFGREAEGNKIITNLRAARLTLLHAESGVGKSSLLRAGVAWRMRRVADDTFARRRLVRSVPVVFTSWKDDPCRDLAGCLGQAIRPYLGENPVPPLPADRLDLAIEAASGAVNASLLIMLDQFEEYFLYRSREPVPERFADQLARCINRTDLRANFLIAIREDAYAGLGDLFKGRIANVYGNYLHIDYLDRASAERAIREPLAVYNRTHDESRQVGIQDKLVEAVLNEVPALGGDGGARLDHPAASGNGDSRIATPLLQLVMDRVWNAERAEGSHELRLATLQKLHGVRMIADAHLEKALGSLSSTERQTALDTFDHLVTPSNGKIAESVADLARRTGHSQEQVGRVLDKLDHQYIVRPIPAAPGQDPIRCRRYEIFHDVLAPTINRAIAAREEHRRVRRTRRLAALAVALLVVVSAIAVAFAYLLVNANNDKLTAESRQLAAESFRNVSSNPELSTQLALAALQVRSTPQAEEALRAALPGLQTVRTLQDGTDVYTAAFDPADHDKVVSGDFYGITSIWDVTTGQRLARMSLGNYASTGGASSAFNASGTDVAVGYGDGQVALFDARTGTKLQSGTDGSEQVNAVAFLGKTGVAAIASQQNVALWQPGTTCCSVLSSEGADTIDVNPQNPRQFVVTTANGNAVVWTMGRSGRPQRLQLGAPSSTVTPDDAEFSPDGSQVVVAETDGDVEVYSLATPKTPVATLNAGEADANTAAFSPDGSQIVVGYSSGTALVWDVATKLPLTELAGNAGGIASVGFSSDGKEVVTAGEDGTIRVWYAEPRELQAEFTISPPGGAPVPIFGLGYIADRIVAAGVAGQMVVFSADGRQQAVISRNAPLTSLAWNNAGTKLVSSDGDGFVTVWQAAGPGYVPVSHPAPMHVDQLLGIDMSRDGSRLADQSGYFTIEVRDADTGHVLRTLSTNYPISQFALSPTGSQVIVGDDYGRVEMWNGTAASPSMLGSSGPPVLSIVYDQSGREFVTAAASGTVTVWNARDGKPVNSIKNACPSPTSASFSPDDSKIVVSCGDGTVRVFEVTTGQSLSVTQATTGGTVSDAAFSPDGTSIVISIESGNTGCVELWNTELATPSLATLQQIADKRVGQQLTAAQVQQYLSSVGG